VGDPLDARIGARAERQHGVVAVWQVVSLGLSASAVRSRVARGRLHVVSRGVVALAPVSLLTPRPDAVNQWIAFPDGGGAEADLLYRRQRLIAEADGRDPHTIRNAFSSDRRRDARLMLLGWRVVRFTWQQITTEPAYVTATLRGLLEAH
jgi:hypothetical protein